MDPLATVIAAATALRCQRGEVAAAIARAFAAFLRSIADLAVPLVAGDTREAAAALGETRLRLHIDALVAHVDAADAPLDPVAIAADGPRLAKLTRAAGVDALDGSVMSLLTALESGLLTLLARLGEKVAGRIDDGVCIDDLDALLDPPLDTPGRLVAAIEALDGDALPIALVTAALLDVVGAPVGAVLPDLEDVDLSDITSAPTVDAAVDAARQIAAEAV